MFGPGHLGAIESLQAIDAAAATGELWYVAKRPGSVQGLLGRIDAEGRVTTIPLTGHKMLPLAPRLRG